MTVLAWLYLAVALPLLSLWRRHHESRLRLALVILPFLLLVAASTPIAGRLAIRSLEEPYPSLRERPADADAIVVLSGYAKEVDGRVELGDDTLFRCVRAAEVYHDGPPIPVLASGGIVDPNFPNSPVAAGMADFLKRLGIRPQDLFTEEASRTTHENAVESARILREHGWRKVILVTEAYHLARACACFRHEGVDVIPCGCRYRGLSEGLEPVHFLPNPSAARGVGLACHEWLGLAWYRHKGWI